MTIATETLPRWDLSAAFPSLESREYAAQFGQFVKEIESLEALFDTAGVCSPADSSHQRPRDSEVSRVLNAWNAIQDRNETIDSYLYGLTTADTKDTAAQAAYSTYRAKSLPLEQLEPRLTSWLGAYQGEPGASAEPVVAQHSYQIERARIDAEHQMSPAEEALFRELHLSGGNSWTRLWDDVSSQYEVEFEVDGEPERVPISKLITLQNAADGELRKRAWEAEVAAWEALKLPIAAAMNSVKGETLTVVKRRGWNSVVDYSAHQNAIDRGILSAMLDAARDSFPTFHRYYRAKARLFGKEQLAWYDMDATVSDTAARIEYLDAVDMIREQFAQFDPAMGAMVERANNEQWIDAGPRSGKIGGAYCMPLIHGEARVLMNYDYSYTDLTTLAHELGHAWHDHMLASHSYMQRDISLIMAETASIFCEALVRDGALLTASDQDALVILDGSLQSSAGVVVDITSRFDIESAIFAAREERELSIDEFCEITSQAKLSAFGDSIMPETLHPWRWAAKSHYYDVNMPFYNYPYMFGMLFSTGLLAHAHESDFPARYNHLLAESGTADASTLAEQFGIDLRSRRFWQESLEIVSRDVDRFEALVEKTLASD